MIYYLKRWIIWAGILSYVIDRWKQCLLLLCHSHLFQYCSWARKAISLKDPLFVSQISMFHIKTIKELQYKYNYTIQKLSNCCHFRLKMTILTLNLAKSTCSQLTNQALVPMFMVGQLLFSYSFFFRNHT